MAIARSAPANVALVGDTNTTNDIDSIKLPLGWPALRGGLGELQCRVCQVMCVDIKLNIFIDLLCSAQIKAETLLRIDIRSFFAAQRKQVLRDVIRGDANVYRALFVEH